MKNLMKEAHKLTKEIKREYPEVNYKAQLGICLSFLSEEKGGIEMVELKGSEKQVAWAKDIRQEMVEAFTTALEQKTAKKEEKVSAGEKVSNKLETVIINLQTALDKINNQEEAKWFIEDFKYFTSDDSKEAKVKEALYYAKHMEEYIK